METELKKQELRPDDKKFTFKWMCFERQLQTGLDVISEFIGTLSNNTIHGMAKIVFNTNTTNIGRFHRGVKHGLHRQFGPDGKLTQVVNFQAGKKVGRSWQMKEGHGLMFQVEDPSGSAEDDVTLAIFNKTIVFAGTDLPHLDTMEDLHLAEITHAEPPPSGDGCLMNDVEWKRQQKLPFRYSYKHRLNIPLAYSEQNFCKSDYLTPQLRLWTMERSKKVDNVTRLADKSVAFLHGDHLPLYFMRPETAPLQEPENESLKFVSGVRPINARNRTFMVGIQGREFETLISDVNFNDQNQLHGSTVILITKDEEKAPKLSWNPERRLIAMEGKFVNGELQGIANLFFNGNQRITGTFRNGILHGGMISYGLSPVLPGVSIKIQDYSQNESYTYFFASFVDET